MRQRMTRLIASTGTVVLLVLAWPGAAVATPPVTEPPPSQSPEESVRRDLALVAEAKGWTVQQAAADRRAAEIIGRIAGKVAAE